MVSGRRPCSALIIAVCYAARLEHLEVRHDVGETVSGLGEDGDERSVLGHAELPPCDVNVLGRGDDARELVGGRTPRR
jgi:hypothetical protein